MRSSESRKVLVVGPLTDRHGQGKMTQAAVQCLKAQNIKLKTLSSYTYGGTVIKVILKLRFFIRLLCFLTLDKFDVIYFTPSRTLISSLPDYLLLLLAPPQCRLIGHLHGSDLQSFFSKYGGYSQRLNEIYSHRLDEMIILSPGHARFALGTNFQRYRVIPNFTEMKLEDAMATQAQDLLFVSVVDKAKGLDTAITLFNLISEESEKLHVIGWHKADFQKIYPDYHGLTDRVIFHGPVYEREAKFDLFRGCHTLLFPSRYESEAQPLVVVEALYCRLRVILTDWRMLEDFCDFPNVFYVDSETYELKLLAREDSLGDDLKIFSSSAFDHGVIDAISA